MLKKLNRISAIALSIMVISAGLLLLLLPDWYFVSLGRSLALQIALGSVLLTGLLTYFKKWQLAVSFLFVALISGTYCYPYLDFARNRVKGEAHLKVAHFNVLKFNRNYKRTIGRALDTKADLLSFQEVDAGWAAALEERLKCDYPYYKIVASEECCIGIAVFSRLPINEIETIYWAGLPNLSGELLTPQGNIHFIASHTQSPTTYGKFRERNEHLDRLADYLASISGPVLSIGDYNAVPWDSRMNIFRKKTGLTDSRKTFTATYPSAFGIYGLPIDYIFHSSDLKCVDFHRVIGTASDHHGVLGSYRFTKINS